MGTAVAVMRAETGRGERVSTQQPRPRRVPRPPDRPPARLPASATLVSRSPAAPIVRAPAREPARTLGLQAWAMQTALKISMPSDPAEREATTISARVTRMAESPALHQGGGALGGVPALRVQRQPTPISQQPLPPAGREATDPTTASRITSQVGGGDSLAQPVRRLMERRLAANFAPVRIHSNARANQLAKDLGARAFTVGADIFFAPGEYQPDSPQGQELLAHELVHTIQQGAVAQTGPGEDAAATRPAEVLTAAGAAPAVARRADTAVQRSADTTVRQRARGQVQRSVVSEALDWFADKANLIPGFRMFTIILGLNPINMSRVERSAANILRALVEFIPGGNLIVRALDSYGVFDRAGAAVEREINALGISGAMIRNAIMEFVNSLGLRDIFRLGDVWERAKRIFTDPIGRFIQLGVNLGIIILRLVRDAILAPLARLAEGTRGYDLLKAVLGRDPITGEAVPRTAETLIGGFMKLIGQEEIWNNIKRANAIPRAWAWFQGAVEGLLGLVRQIPQLFISALQTLEWTDIVLLPRAFMKVASVFGGFIGQFLSWAGNAMWNLLQIIFEVVAPAAMPYLRRVGAAIRSIFRNPLPFVGNLVRAAKLGFQNFARNFVTHLRTGLINWLTGSLPGVYIPTAFTLLEFGKFALSVFGISWAQIRAKIVRALGPNGATIMTALETTFDIIVALVRGGPAAAWDLIKERLSTLKDQIVDGIIGFVRDTIIQQAVPRLIAMFIPGAGFISAIISIYGTIRTLIDQISRIMAVVQAFLDGLMAIAAGNIQPAAQRVERVLASLLSLAISLLAGFVGLGRVADRVMGVINRVRESVDRALDAAVNFVVGRARALFARLFTVGVPQDPRERLRLAIRAAQTAARALRGRVTRQLLQPVLTAIQTRYGLTRIEALERDGRWRVRVRINPDDEGDLGVSSTQSATGEDADAAAVRALIGRQIVIRAQGTPARLAITGSATTAIRGYDIRLGSDTEAPSVRKVRRPSGAAPLPDVYLDDQGILREGLRPGQRKSDEATKLAMYRALATDLQLGAIHPEVTEANVTATSNSRVREGLRDAILGKSEYQTLTGFNRLISSGKLTGPGMQGELFEAWVVRHFGSAHDITNTKVKYKTSKGVGIMDRFSGTTILEIKSRVRPSSVAPTVPDDEISETRFAIFEEDRDQFERYAELVSGQGEIITKRGSSFVIPASFAAARYYFNFRGVAALFARRMPQALRSKTSFYVGGSNVQV